MDDIESRHVVRARAPRRRGRGRPARRHPGPAGRGDRQGAGLLRVLHLRLRGRARPPARPGHLVAQSPTRTTSTGSARCTGSPRSPTSSASSSSARSSSPTPTTTVDAATAGFETMEYWGELAAIWAPIVHGDEVLGILELTEKEHDRRVHRARTSGSCARWRRSPPSRSTTRAPTRAAEERNRQLTALIDASRAMTSTLDLDELLEVICRQAALALDAGVELHLRVRRRGATPWSGWPSTSATPSHGFEEPLGTVYPIEDLPQDLAVVRTRRPVEVRLDDPDLDPVMRGAARWTGARCPRSWCRSSSATQVVGSLEVSEVVVPAPLHRAGDRPLRGARRAGRRGHPQRAAVPPPAGAERRPSSCRPPPTASRGSPTTATSGRRLRDEVARAQRATASRSRCSCSTSTTSSTSTTASATPWATSCCARWASALQTQLRQGVDCAARYGGEEFAVILPSTESELESGALDGAVTTAERIRAAVARPARPRRRSGLARDHREHRRGHPAGARGRRRGRWCTRADQALYWAKARGKDTVAVFGAY